jgi:hypothetical protein
MRSADQTTISLPHSVDSCPDFGRRIGVIEREMHDAMTSAASRQIAHLPRLNCHRPSTRQLETEHEFYRFIFSSKLRSRQHVSSSLRCPYTNGQPTEPPADVALDRIYGMEARWLAGWLTLVAAAAAAATQRILYFQSIVIPDG